MRTKFRIVLPILCVAILGGIAWSALRPGEPVYQGRRLSGWLEEYAAQYLIPPVGHLDQYFRPPNLHPDERVVAADVAAIRYIGSEAVPSLVGMVEAKDSPLKQSLTALIQKQPLVPFHPRTAAIYHQMAELGFMILGPDAKAAVPALVGLLHNRDQEIQKSAIASLYSIGPAAQAAQPALLPFLNHTNLDLQEAAIACLGNLGPAAQDAVPVLLPYLNHTNVVIRHKTKRALDNIQAPIELGSISSDIGVASGQS
ncbi:MAG: repeat protein [Pedosphaera sp.]|nr:repeat protein [Pedosphaera sp.]